MKKNIGVIILAVITITVMVLALTNIINQSLGMCIALGLVVIFSITVSIYAFKKDVNMIAYLMLALTILGIILFGFNIYACLKITKTSEYNFQITVKNLEGPKKLLFNHNGYNYYTYNVSDINVILKKDNNTYKLQEALTNNLITLEEILSLAAPNTDTVGYKIYYDGGQSEYYNDQYSIVVCENENKDVIFSTFNYIYNDDICK